MERSFVYVSADKANDADKEEYASLFIASFTNGKPVYFKEKTDPQVYLSKFMTEV
jgi:hypothetical protein